MQTPEKYREGRAPCRIVSPRMESWSICPVVPIKLCLRVVLGHVNSSALLWMQPHRPPRSCGAHRGLGQEWKEAWQSGCGPCLLGIRTRCRGTACNSYSAIRGGWENEMWVTEILAPHSPSRLVPSLFLYSRPCYMPDVPVTARPLSFGSCSSHDL